MPRRGGVVCGRTAPLQLPPRGEATRKRFLKGQASQAPSGVSFSKLPSQRSEAARQVYLVAAADVKRVRVEAFPLSPPLTPPKGGELRFRLFS